MDKSIAALKHEWHEELVQLKKRCKIIENRLQGLDDYDSLKTGKSYRGTPLAREARSDIKPGTRAGFTAFERAGYTLIEMPEPFTLVQLRQSISKDGLGEIHRGNWGTIVQKLKKIKMIVCSEGEEGKPGALYRRLEGSPATCQAIWAAGKRRS